MNKSLKLIIICLCLVLILTGCRFFIDEYKIKISDDVFSSQIILEPITINETRTARIVIFNEEPISYDTIISSCSCLRIIKTVEKKALKVIIEYTSEQPGLNQASIIIDNNGKPDYLSISYYVYN